MYELDLSEVHLYIKVQCVIKLKITEDEKICSNCMIMLFDGLFPV